MDKIGFRKLYTLIMSPNVHFGGLNNLFELLIFPSEILKQHTTYMTYYYKYCVLQVWLICEDSLIQIGFYIPKSNKSNAVELWPQAFFDCINKLLGQFWLNIWPLYLAIYLNELFLSLQKSTLLKLGLWVRLLQELIVWLLCFWSNQLCPSFNHLAQGWAT